MDARLRHALGILVVLLALGSTTLKGQVISMRTVPLATGDQFLIPPSDRLGMGGVSIAIDDWLLDPFVNPAKGSLIRESTFVGSPTFYSISGTSGAGRTLPLSALFRSDRSFGALSFALQEIESGSRLGRFFIPVDVAWIGPPNPVQRLDEASSTNVFAHGVIGRELNDDGLSIGASVSIVGLNAVDGVEFLYAQANNIDQSGHALDTRVGIFSDRDGKHFEALLVHRDWSMTHDVNYLDWRWDEAQMRPFIESRIETNLDKTRTWGLHLGFAQPLTETGWRVGGILTANRKSHPKIPNYEIMNIPRDPGTSWGYDLGVGIAKTSGRSSFGIDVVVEPIWSDTWVEAEADTVSSAGKTIEEGEKTLENEFFFTNVRLNMGFAHETDRWRAQLGVEARSYDYSLEQRDLIAVTFREQDESWMEWTPTLGAAVKLSDFELSYVGLLTTGTGRPGIDFVGGPLEAPVADAAPGGDIILAPSGPLTLQDTRVYTHRITVSLPIR